MGVLGGLFGALFNQFNTIITNYRMNHVAKKKGSRVLRYVHRYLSVISRNRRLDYFRLLEVLLVAMVTTVVVFTLATTLGSCVSISKVFCVHWCVISIPLLCHCFCQSNHTKEFQSEIKTYFCPDGKYNDMATLLFNSQEEAIRQLFHQDGKISINYK